jgi:hypothetical protein
VRHDERRHAPTGDAPARHLRPHLRQV